MQGTYLTIEDLKCLEEKQGELPSSILDLKLPYPTHIVAKAYPKDYVSPRFKMFNGKRGNVKEHIMKIIENTRVYALDDDSKLKELPKSFMD